MIGPLRWSRAAGEQDTMHCLPASHHSLETQKKYGVSADYLLHIPNGIDLRRYHGGDGEQAFGENWASARMIRFLSLPPDWIHRSALWMHWLHLPG